MVNVNSIRNKFVSIQELLKRTFDKLRLIIHFQMRNLKQKVIKVLEEIEMPLGEDFSFTLMKSGIVDF